MRVQALGFEVPCTDRLRGVLDLPNGVYCHHGAGRIPGAIEEGLVLLTLQLLE
jgi:hypothetical protein